MESSGKEILENNIDSKIYIIMNKPKGYVCSAVSDSHKTVYELLPEELQSLVKNAKRGNRLHTVGRLDCDTTGLLILTTDGYLSNYLTRSENNISKSYLATLKDAVTVDQQNLYTEKASKGLLLPAEKKAPEEMCLPCNIEWINEKQAKVTVIEGKFHEVRRIFLALGNEVTELKRMTICNLNLQDFDLEDGQYKYLYKKDLMLLKTTL